MMKKLFCVLLTMLLLLCCASALAEECKYAGQGSPCDVRWWVDTLNRMHARACFYHVEEKEDMDSHVLVTDWASCTLDAGGQCTVCNWDYVREPEVNEYDEYWAWAYNLYYEWYGVPPLEITDNNGKLTIAFKADFFTFMDENGIPYTESAMVATEITLTEVGGVEDVEVSEFGPGRWLMRAGMMSVEGPNGGVVEVTVEGKTYTLGSAGGVDLDHCRYYKEDSPCRPGWWVKEGERRHARACFYHVEEKEDMSSHVLITPWEDCTLDAESVCTVCGYDYDPDLTQEDYDIMLLESFYALAYGAGVTPLNVTVDGSCMTVSFTDDLFALMDEFERPYQESTMRETVITLAQAGGSWTVTVSEEGPGPWLQRMGWLEIGSIEDEGDSASVEITVYETAYTLTAGGVDLEHCDNYVPGGTPCDVGYVGSLTDEKHAYVCFSHGATENDYVLMTAWTACTVDEDDVCIICGNDFGKFEEEEEAYEQSLVEAYYAYVDRMGTAPVNGVVSGDTLTITLTIDYFALLDEMGIVSTEHLQAETLYTLRETAEGWQVVSSGYGPGLWLEEYGLLGIDLTVHEDGTATAYIAADCGEGYTLPEDNGGIRYCKYGSASNPCFITWQVETADEVHRRVCINHVEEKDDPYSYVPVTDWVPCPIGEDYRCPDCGWDYTPASGPSEEDYDAYMLEIYYKLLEKKGFPPMDVTLDGDTLTIKVNEQFQMYMLEYGIPVTEALLVGTTYTLKQADGAWVVEASEYGPGAWLARMNLIAVGAPAVSGGKATAEIALDGGEGYVLTAGAAEGSEQDKVCYHRADCSAPTTCTICGVTGADIPAHCIDHDYSSRPVSQGDKHARVCGSCGQEYDKSVHSVRCDEPDVCEDCGGAVTADMQVEKIHPTDTGYWFENAGDQHYYDCYACGERWYTDHWVMCDNPNKCLQCDADNLNIELSHEWYSMFNVNSETHSFHCVRCKKDYTKPHEFDLNGCCDRCGYLREEQPIFPVILPGDADGDGAVGIMDALNILQFDVGWDVSVNLDAADVDDSGAVDIMDALLILQYDVGWDVELK